MANIPNRPEYQSELFKKGLEVRRDVLGADYVDGSLTRATYAGPSRPPYGPTGTLL